MLKKVLLSSAIVLSVVSPAFASAMSEDDKALLINGVLKICNSTDILEHGFERTRRYCDHYLEHYPKLIEAMDSTDTQIAKSAKTKFINLSIGVINVEFRDKMDSISNR